MSNRGSWRDRVSGIVGRRGRTKTSSQGASESMVSLHRLGSFLGRYDDIPQAHVARQTDQAVVVTFLDERDLPEPFVQDDVDPMSWTISHADIAELPLGEDSGVALAGLLPLGTPAVGETLLISSVASEIISLAGDEQFSQDVMVGLAMEQALAPWAEHHQVHLVGFDDLGEKISNLVSSYYPDRRVERYSSIEEISTKNLQGLNTIYSLGSTPETVQAYHRLAGEASGSTVGMILDDDLVMPEVGHMCLTDLGDGTVQIDPFVEYQIVFTPKRADGQIYAVLEQVWEDQLHQQVAEAGDLSGFQESVTETDAEEQETDADRDDDDDILAAESARGIAAFEKLLAEHSSASTPGAKPEQNLTQTQEEAAPENPRGDLADELLETPAQPTSEPSASADETDETAGDDEDEGADGEEQDDLQSATSENPGSGTEEGDSEESASALEDQQSGQVVGQAVEESAIRLLGTVEVITEHGRLAGRAAEAVALLSLHPDGLTPAEISAALWDDTDDVSSNTTRRRRTRLKTEISEITAVTADTSGWRLAESLTTDLEALITLMTATDSTAELRIAACQRLTTPLQDVESALDEHREEITTRIDDALEEATIQTPALPEDEAQQARERMGVQ